MFSIYHCKGYFHFLSLKLSFRRLLCTALVLPLFAPFALAQEGFVDDSGNLVLNGQVIAPPSGSIDGSGNLVLGGEVLAKPEAQLLENGELKVGDAVFPIPTGGFFGCPEPGYNDDPILHWVYNFEGCWALWYADFNAGDWGYLYLGERGIDGYGWVYHLEKGWIHLTSGDVASHLFIYSVDLGWIAAYESAGGGQFWRYDTESFMIWNN